MTDLAPEEREKQVVVGVREGWRAWGIPLHTLPGEPPKLYSVTHADYYWRPRRVSQALCSRGHVGDQVPGEVCGCGFYSAKSLEHLMSMGYHTYDAERQGFFHVIGKVGNWGKVIEGDQGWRAQKAYPMSLYVPFEAWKLGKVLKEAYGVPVRLKNFLKTSGEIDPDDFDL
jgi:hypothetical protein